MNTGVLDANKNLVSKSDLTEWKPIGARWSSYTGTFDGQGYTISGLYFNNPTSSYVGLFGSIGANGKISNVGVLDSYFQFSELGGGVCGVNYGTVRDCKNTGSVRGLAAIGGVCGLNEKGGIIENSFNEGTVSGTGDNVQQVGGVCGYNNGTIKSCYNTASVSGQNSVGGVCGLNSRGIITNCFNEGTVSGQTFVGGVCGNGCGVTTTNCFNGGIVSGQSHVSGVCGYDYNYDGTLTNCYYLSDTAKGGINGKDVSGKAEGKSIEQFKSGEVAYLLNGSTSEGELAWYQKLGTDAYPVLTATKGNTVYNGSFRYCDNTAASYSNSTSEDVLVHQMSATLASPEHDADKHIYHMDCRNEGCTLHKYVADKAGNIEVTKDANNKFVATEDLTLADGEDFKDYEPFISKTISYSRDIPKGSTWGTLCLPFAIDQSQVKECKFYSLTGIDNDCITLESYEEGIIPAGTPVLFKMNEGKTSLSLSASNAEIATAPTVAGTNTDVNLVGSFTKIGGKDNKGLDKNDYIIGKNKFWRVSDLDDGNRVGIKPMRAYIHPANEYLARAAMLSIGKGDGTTAIDNLNAISNDANAEYYDANGRRTNGLQKGLNIVKRGSKTYKIMVK
ncbi:GLUG motif-containing protein [Segatella copri]|uniref:GLUG motif-containing protein n=1 Tax=Segatella copri TaxID=165179 RepID=UPI001862B356|nr:GLUG motif-containing protein [Segatella copri]MBM0156360.1 hypothetical protein [Segatella copri]QNT67236.1 hypothetical protein FO447_12290 [Segatella copri]